MANVMQIIHICANTIKYLILTCTTLVINTKVSFTIVDQWQRMKGKGGQTLQKQWIICQENSVPQCQKGCCSENPSSSLEDPLPTLWGGHWTRLPNPSILGNTPTQRSFHLQDWITLLFCFKKKKKRRRTRDTRMPVSTLWAAGGRET